MRQHATAARAGLAAAALALGACAGAPPRPSSAEHGLLAARVVVRGAIFSFLKKEASFGVAVKLKPDGTPQDGPGAASGFAKDGYFYFLDLPPGRYALVSAGFRARGTRYRVVLPPGEISRRAVTLRAGEAAFLGEYELGSVYPEGPEARRRALRLLGRWVTFWRARHPMPRDAELRDADLGPRAEGRAMLSARDSLAGTGWRRLALERIRRLGTTEPAPTKGFVRQRPLELKQEPFFAWRDVLRWGEPIRLDNGLEWRRPGGGARAAVWFTTATAKGFRGYEQAVRQLRALVVTEGSGRLEEVRVSTRLAAAGRTERWVYPEATLVGSERRVVVTETVLVPDGYGMYTARLRADKDEFEQVAPRFRRLLEQLSLGPPGPKEEARGDPVLFFPER